MVRIAQAGPAAVSRSELTQQILHRRLSCIKTVRGKERTLPMLNTKLVISEQLTDRPVENYELKTSIFNLTDTNMLPSF